MEALFYEQVKGSTILAAELAGYNRAVKVSAMRTYQFFYDVVVRPTKRKRHERNRNAKLQYQDKKGTRNKERTPPATEGQPEKAVPPKELPCFAFQKGQCKRGKKCKYPHDPEVCKTAPATQDPAPKAKAKAKPKAQPKSLSKAELERRKQIQCRNFGRPVGCKFGDECQFSHAAAKATICTQVVEDIEIAAPAMEVARHHVPAWA